MLTNTVSKILFYGTVLVFIALTCSGFIASQIDYDWLIAYVLHSMNRNDLFEIITTKYFTQQKFELLKIMAWGFTACSVILLFVLFKFKTKLINANQQFVDAGFILNRNFWIAAINNSRMVNMLLLVSMVAIVIRSIYYANTFYIQYDEAWNYNYFLHNNILYSGFAYNNYPLHNFVSWIFVKIFSPHSFVLRLPSIIAGVLSCLLVFVAIKKIFKNEWLAFGSTLLFSCLPISIFYMLYARGVMFEMFVSILLCYFLFTRGIHKLSIRQIIFFAILNALGTYSMLSHVYFIALSTLFLVIFKIYYRPMQIKHLILYPVLSLGFSFLLLLPMALGTGLSLGLSASVGNASYLVLHMMPYHCYSDFMTGAWFLFYIFIVINAILLFIKTSVNIKMIIFANLVMLAAPWIIKFSTGIFPPERGLAFLCIVPITSVAMVIEVFKVKRMYWLAGIVLAIFILSYTTHFHAKLNWSKELDMQVSKLAKALISKEDVSIYSTTSKFNYFVPGVQYYFTISGRNFQYNTNETGSSRYKPAFEAPCTITETYLGKQDLLFSYDSMYVYFKK